jgi:MFS family permease
LLTPATITLALRVRQLVPGNSAGPVSVVLFAGALVALISNPVFGALSDRTRSRFGRRRPYLVAGALGGFAALTLIAVATSLGVVLLGWCLAQLAYNAVLAALVAIVPDRIPSSRRGTVVGILGVCMPVGQIGGTFLVQQFAGSSLVLLIPGAIGLAGVLVLAFVLPDEPPARALATPSRALAETSSMLAMASSAPTAMPSAPMATSSVLAATSSVPVKLSRRFDLPGHRDFLWAWLSRILFVTGFVFLQAYQPFLLLDQLGFDAAQVPRLIFRSTLVQAAMMVLWSLVAGRLSDRIGRRKSIAMVGSVLQGMGLWLVAAAHSYTTFLFGVALGGMGHGVYEGVNLALVTELLPDRDRHAAKDLGLLNITNALPQVIAPLAAPAILEASGGDYMLLFLVAGAVPMLGAVFLTPLKSVR